MPYFNDFLILTPMSAFRGHFVVVRGYIMLGSSRDFLWTFLNDPFVKEFQLFIDILTSQFQVLKPLYAIFNSLILAYIVAFRGHFEVI